MRGALLRQRVKANDSLLGDGEVLTANDYGPDPRRETWIRRHIESRCHVACAVAVRGECKPRIRIQDVPCAASSGGEICRKTSPCRADRRRVCIQRVIALEENCRA